MANEQLQSLVKTLQQLDSQALQSVADFAAFLLERQGGAIQLQPQQPAHIARPDDETVVAAIKRLSTIYPMLDRSKMLNSTSALMSQHVMQGRAAAEVIDELETLFQSHYKTYLAGFEQEPEQAHKLPEGPPPQPTEAVSEQAEPVDNKPMSGPARPVDIPKPASEKVGEAIKRLMATYPMLERKQMLNVTSNLAAQHVMGGRSAIEVIAELELTFQKAYENYCQEYGKST